MRLQIFPKKLRISFLVGKWVEVGVCGRRHAPDTPIVDRREWAASYSQLGAEGGRRAKAASQPQGKQAVSSVSWRKRAVQRAPECRHQHGRKCFKSTYTARRSIVNTITYQDKRRSEKTVSDTCIHVRPAAPQQGTFTVRRISPPPPRG